MIYERGREPENTLKFKLTQDNRDLTRDSSATGVVTKAMTSFPVFFFIFWLIANFSQKICLSFKTLAANNGINVYYGGFYSRVHFTLDFHVIASSVPF